MGNSTWHNALDPAPIARSAAVNTFTAFQDVAGKTNVLPATYANELKVGSRVELEAWGEFSTTVTPTLQLGFIYGAVPNAAGGTTIAASGLITTASGAAAFPWHMRYSGIITAVSATTGTIYGSGILDLGTALTTFASSALPITAAARSVATLDTTTMKLWGVGAAYSASSVSNQVIVDVFTATVINQGKT